LGIHAGRWFIQEQQFRLGRHRASDFYSVLHPIGKVGAPHFRDVGGAVRGDVPPVAHNGDPVAQIKDLIEAVGDEEDPGSFVPEAAGHGAKALRFPPAQGGGGPDTLLRYGSGRAGG